MSDDIEKEELEKEEQNRELLEYIIKGVGEGNLYKSERIARIVMVELVKAGRADFLLLKNDEVSAWWNGIYNGIRSKVEKYKEKMRLYELRLQGYNKLSAAERKTLGIRKPVKPKG